MTKDELFKLVQDHTEDDYHAECILTAVDRYSAALIAAKPLVSGTSQLPEVDNSQVKPSDPQMIK